MTKHEAPPASLRLRVDTQALAANWRSLDALSGDAATGAAIKANAYGVGIAKAVPALRDAGAAAFFLAHWSEVPAVLEHAAPGTVSVLHGVSNADEAAFAQATGVRPVINSILQAEIWQRSGGGPCHLMVDTGINRLGISPDEVSHAAIRALDIDIAMSHLASADEDSPLNARQLSVFKEIAATLRAARLSLCNSAGIMLGSQYHFDLTRPGLALYGGLARPEFGGRIAQVVYPEAAVLQLRNLSAGDSVGYNATWTADRSVRAATISLGYADGFLRACGPGSALQHGGASLPILGKVSMDMVVVDASASDVKEGDFVSIPFDLREIASRSGLSQYEVLTVLGDRFDRF